MEYNPNAISNNLFDQEPSGEPISEVIKRDYLPYWPIILGVGIIGLLIAHIVIRYTQPLYVSKATVMFRNNNQNKTQQVLSELTGFGGQQQDKTKQNLEIMLGHDVAMRALSHLRLNAQLYSQGRVIKQPLYKRDILFNCIFLQPDSIRSFKGDIVYNAKRKKFFVGKQELLINKACRIGPNKIIFTMDKENEKKLAKEKYELNIYSNAELKQLFDKMTATELKGKPSVELSITTEDPLKSKEMLSAILKAYNDYAIEENRNEAIGTIHFIDERINLLENELDSVESGIEQFRRANPFVSMSSAGTDVLTDVKESDRKLSEIDLQLSMLADVEKYIQGNGKKPGMLPSFAGIQFGNEIQQFLLKLYDAELEHEKIKLISAEKSEQYIISKERLETLRGTIAEIGINVRRNLMTIRKQAEREVNRYSGIISAMPAGERKLFDINRQQAIKNELYTFLLQKREESAISASVAVSDLVILEPPVVLPRPVNIKQGQAYSFGVLSGFGLVAVVVFFTAILNDKIVSRQQIEAHTRMPILGTISLSKDEDHLVMSDNTRTAISEQFRALRTNIGYYKKEGNQCMTILITSSIPGEGKSFNAANIAMAFALTGEKTLLIESDLRKPNISKHFDVERNKGLSNFLVGKANWPELVSLTAYPDLYILPSGPIPPNPVELIMNGKYATLFKEASIEYKYIVIDCPPLGVVTDAELIAQYADMMLFVTRHNYTPKDFIEKLVNKYNTEKKITNAGIVYNGLKPKGIGYYGYKYGYGYGYSYGYGYYNNDN
jgi:capsular exopolysaccharide synthesis family protein